MAYSTLADIKSRFSDDMLKQITDDLGVDAIDETLAGVAIADADIEIDGYIFKRYTTPLAAIPDIIKLKSIDIALYKLYQNRYDYEIPDNILKRRNEAIKYLEEVQSGEETLPGISTTIDFDSAVVTNKVAADQVFTETVMDTY